MLKCSSSPLRGEKPCAFYGATDEAESLATIDRRWNSASQAVAHHGVATGDRNASELIGTLNG
ncbi:hypothetical protein ACFXJ5_24395 [Streptomyces sp. NPDC059373]